jgi:hypothetical protein
MCLPTFGSIAHRSSMSLIPSMIVYATTAFAMLRYNGVEIGKAGLLGAIDVLRRLGPRPRCVTKECEGTPQ